MKNILQEKPLKNLTGRLKYSVNFVEDKDIKNKNILDIGCGYGWCELNFLQRGAKKISGIEISEYDLSTVKEHVKHPKTELKIGSALDIPYPDNYFDNIVSWEVIEHIPKNTEDKMFKEVGRVLKPGGSFYLSTPYKQVLSNILDPAWWLIGHRHYSKKQLKTYGEYVNFKIEKIKTAGGIWSLLSIINFYISKWIFKKKPILNSFFTKMDDKEYSAESGIFNIFIKYRKL
jgi:ubiquinone/menaquinone biosynthesis C-methylase UbiE